MQPLDRTFLKALKNRYNSESDIWMVTQKGERISFFEMTGIFVITYNSIFSDEDFVAAEVITNETQTEPNTTVNPSTTAVATVVTSQSTASTGGAMSVTTIAATTTTTADITIVSIPVQPTTSTTTTWPTSDDPTVTAAINTETNITPEINVGVMIAKDITSVCSSQRARCLLANLITPIKVVKLRQRKRKTERATKAKKKQKQRRNSK